MEAERVRAVRLVCDEGWSAIDAAKAVECSQRSVQLWCQKSERGKRPEQLRTKKAPGAKPKLNGKQREKLVRLRTKGSLAAGFVSQLWTGPMVQQLIQREFGASDHARFLPTLIRQLGFTPQRPKVRPTERDEALTADWIKRRWPAIKKTRQWGASRCCLEESAFQTVPDFQRTWALKGQTPHLKQRLRHRLKVTLLGTLTLSPARRRCGWYADFLPHRSVTTADVIAHLSRLRRRLGTPLVVVLDNLRQHKSAALVALCEKVGDVSLEYLPPYAPELSTTAHFSENRVSDSPCFVAFVSFFEGL